MEIFQVALIFSTLLCSLVAGFVLAFACVVMPGFANLGDREFLRAFQVVDRVIQNNQPLFIFVWVGSAVAAAAALFLSVQHTAGVDRFLIVAAGLIYLVGVQAPTAAFNIPLNNQLQTLAVDSMSPTELAEARERFEGPWNRWNNLRTFFATASSLLLLISLLRL